MLNITKPESGEYAPYMIDYINLVPENQPILQILEDNLKMVTQVIKAVPAGKLDIPFAPGEWTVKEILVHNLDSERAFSYRAMRFARNDPTELFPLDQDLYVKNSKSNNRSIEDILEEYAAVRNATLTLYKSFDEETILRCGMVKGNRVCVRALAWITAGHEIHHLNSIQQNYQ